MPVGTTAWNIEGIRLTSFLSPGGAAPDLENWFEVLTGSRPNQYNRIGGQTSASGLLNGKLLEIGMNQMRLDVGLRSPEVQRLSSNIGEINCIRELSEELINPLFVLPGWPDSNRLAIGISIVLPIGSQEEAQAVWRDIHGVEISGGGDSTDFLYRINRPSLSSTMQDTQINRLISWQSANIQLFHLQAQLNNQSGVTNILPTESNFVCKIDIDVNTPGEKLLQANAAFQHQIANELIDISVVLVNQRNF